MKNIKQLLTLALVLITVSAFAQKNKKPAYDISPLGMKYKLYKTNKGTKAKVGDIIKINIISKTEKDSVLSNTFTENKPLTMEIVKPSFKGDLMEGFTFMTEGDSGNFLVSVDSLAQGNPLPPFLKSGEFLKFDIKLVDIVTKEEFEQNKQKTEQEEKTNQELAIEKYAKEKNLKLQKTPSGLYYTIETPGTGDNAKPGDNVSVHYKGYMLDGKVFDESFGRGEPITFPLGQGQVIAGWDEGIQMFKKGGKGKLLIPSRLAYGPQASGPIPANSILIFDIELVDIAK
jgi:FKBP-type peptidyl-prolyl cis-trans isomerase